MSKKSRERYQERLKTRAPSAHQLDREVAAFKATAPKHSDMTPDWTGKCSTCGESPIVPQSGMCGPCTFGEAATAGGNW